VRIGDLLSGVGGEVEAGEDRKSGASLLEAVFHPSARSLTRVWRVEFISLRVKDDPPFSSFSFFLSLLLLLDVLLSLAAIIAADRGAARMKLLELFHNICVPHRSNEEQKESKICAAKSHRPAN